ncbi:hypothetical protein [Gloeocapsopsis dulcis]|uniref:hypothetical protein n=1 Tax=Gloeocapsopsis dulcis TaxID=2859516 RepID=UPI001F3EB1F4|nr:hypothetical protein [Gloeocapsopsis dulcis]WNN89084.1 hypothetical protein P0S91_22990 [Gloeocapsopsis dulcis]
MPESMDRIDRVRFPQALLLDHDVQGALPPRHPLYRSRGQLSVLAASFARPYR